MSGDIFIMGELATHARGKTIQYSFEAEIIEDFPDSGVVIMFGKELQSNETLRDEGFRWVEEAGRLLIAIPTFQLNVTSTPEQWSIQKATAIAGGNLRLVEILAKERKYQILGNLIPFEKNTGQMVTAGWKKHPDSGLFLITTLPLWSLFTMTEKDACSEWIQCYRKEAGKRVQKIRETEEEVFSPSDDEWTFLLHLCQKDFQSKEEAFQALAISEIHSISQETAEQVCVSLNQEEILNGIHFTSLGEELILTGRYAHFAQALWRNR